MPRKVTFRAGVEGGPTKDVTVEIHDLDPLPWGVGEALRHVGGEIPRVEGALKATGAARYTYDVFRPGMAYVKLLRSWHAHATVAELDVTAASRVPGVLGVEPLLAAGGRITFAGQGVAAVCAETEEALDDGLAAISVRYDVEPCAVTTEDARLPDAPRVDPRRENAFRRPHRGARPDDAAAALAKSHAQVSATFRTQVQTHSALETHGCVVEPNGDGTYTVWASTQGTRSFRDAVAASLGVENSRVRVVSEHIGGGFGAKLGGIDAWDAAAARFARELKRPVKALLDRREEHLVAGNRPDSIQDLTLGADREGSITALVGTVHGTAGNGAGGAGAANSRVYRIPILHMEQTTVSTFAGRGRAFRAPGHPQGMFALEGIVDMLATRLGMDPLEFRLRNDPHPVRAVQWREGAEKIAWKERRKLAPGAGEGPLKRGVGCAAAIWSQAGGGRWVVNVEVDAEGGVVVSNAVQDIGTGTRTVLAIIVAEELGIDPARVTVRIGDTSYPAGPASGGSRTAPSIAPAAREAAARAREALAGAAAEDWSVAATEVRCEDGVFKGPAGRKASFDEVCALLGADGVSVSGQRRPNYAGFADETAGCQFAEVEVDTDTGVVRVLRVVAVHDAGRIVDALTARSQVIGGVIQGVSYALLEDRRLDRNLGDMVNPTLDTYRILGIADCPQIDVVLTSLTSGFNNTGMMGLGEPVTVPTAGAIANAVFHATGVRVTELPLTPARVLAALRRGR